METKKKTFFFGIDGFGIYKPSLGRGSFGRVYLAVHKETGAQFACKVMNINNISAKKGKEMVLREIVNAAKLTHTGVNRLRVVKRSETEIFLFFDLCNGGDLAEFCKRYQCIYKQTLPEEAITWFGRQIADTLLYLNNRGVAHRDLKLANIILTDSSERLEAVESNIFEWKTYESMLKNLPVCSLKRTGFDEFVEFQKVDFTSKLDNLKGIKVEIIDFGFSIDTRTEQAKSFLGTPSTVAPEILNRQVYSVSCDIWSFGCILFKLKTGVNPFPGKTVDELFEHVTSGNLTLPKGKYSLTFLDLIEKMLNFDPKKRILLEEALKHPFFNENSDFIELDCEKVINVKNQQMKTYLMLKNEVKDCESFNLDIELKEEIVSEGDEQYVLITFNYD